jgi:uncharacterized membrane protein
MQNLIAALDFIFGCHRSHRSRIFTIDSRTYRVCSECEAKFRYSLTNMAVDRRYRL